MSRKPEPEPPLLVTRKEAARLLAVTERRLQKPRARRAIQAGKAWRVGEASAKRYRRIAEAVGGCEFSRVVALTAALFH